MDEKPTAVSHVRSWNKRLQRGTAIFGLLMFAVTLFLVVRSLIDNGLPNGAGALKVLIAPAGFLALSVWMFLESRPDNR